MAVVYRRVKKHGRKVDLVILHMDIVHLAAVCYSAPLASATSSRPNLQIVNLDELIPIGETLKEGFDGQWIWHSLTAIWLISSICIGGKESGFEGSVTFWYSLLVAISCWSLVLKASSSSTFRFNQAIAMKLCDFDCYELHRDMFLAVYRWWTEWIGEDRCHLETETVRGGYGSI